MMAVFFQPPARFLVHQRIEYESGIGGEFGHDPVQMLAAADHRPEMAHHIGIFELGKRGLGDHFQRFTGGIRNEMEMDALHGFLRFSLWRTGA